MINMFRTVLLNMTPATANSNTTVPGYMYTDAGYVTKELNNTNREIWSALFVGATTDEDKVIRATTIHKVVEQSMLSDVITAYDSRVTGLNSLPEEAPAVLPNIIERINTLIIDPTILLFTNSLDAKVFAEHAFYRDEPAEIIAGFSCAIVNDIIITRRLV